MQTRSKAFDDLANLLTNAFGAVKSVGDEAKAVSRAQVDKFIADMDLVTREEFDVVKKMASDARAEVAALRKELAALAPKAKAKAKPKPKAKPKTAPKANSKASARKSTAKPKARKAPSRTPKSTARK